MLAPSLRARIQAERAGAPWGRSRLESLADAARARLPLLDGPCHRPAHRAARSGRARRALHQGAGARCCSSARAKPTDIHAADLSDLLGRHGISLIADQIEAETRWSNCSTTTCGSARASCSRRRARCGPRRSAGGAANAQRQRRRTPHGARPRAPAQPPAAALDRAVPGQAIPRCPLRPHRSSNSFATLAAGYDAVLSDVWGVIHNGVAATPEACDALVRFRAKGGTVVLITNAPRPGAVVTKFLDKLNVPREAYDGIVSSGDVTRAVIARAAGQERLSHRAGARPADLRGTRLRFVPLEQADYVVCTGLTDDKTETPESYRDAADASARAQPVHDLRQSRPGGRARRQAGLLRRRDRRSLRRARRRSALRRQAVSADLRAGAARSRRCAAAPAARARAGDRGFGAHRPEGRRRRWGSIACSSPPASMPRNSAERDRRTAAALTRCSRSRRRERRRP